MKFKFFSSFAALVAIVIFSSISFAQETNTQNNSQDSSQNERRTDRFERNGKRRGMHGGRQGMKFMRMMSDLNLSDAQKQQMSTMIEINKSSLQPQREELRQIWSQKQTGGATALTPDQESRARELMTQLREANKKLHDDLLALLTPEQRQQLEQKRQEKRQRWQERRQIKPTGETTTPQN